MKNEWSAPIGPERALIQGMTRHVVAATKNTMPMIAKIVSLTGPSLPSFPLGADEDASSEPLTCLRSGQTPDEDSTPLSWAPVR